MFIQVLQMVRYTSGTRKQGPRCVYWLVTTRLLYSVCSSTPSIWWWPAPALTWYVVSACVYLFFLSGLFESFWYRILLFSWLFSFLYSWCFISLNQIEIKVLTWLLVAYSIDSGCFTCSLSLILKCVFLWYMRYLYGILNDVC